ncbi:septum formation family protein [Pontimonas salivibrio]|uniref:septum formation family protein n=1 Tax=Pontimonas salivibrio TaxID=1159327 RepID=UPI001319F42E|nr:septum formation family protein [Pontimonas salivibrio]
MSPADAGGGDTALGVLELEVGTCLNDVDQPLAQDLTDIPSVPCNEPHQSEVFAEVTVDSGEYPGVDSVTAQATSECMSEFGRFVGLDFAASRLNYHFYYPTASSWALGDRSIYCVVFDPGVETAGTLQGVAR